MTTIMNFSNVGWLTKDFTWDMGSRCDLIQEFRSQNLKIFRVLDSFDVCY